MKPYSLLLVAFLWPAGVTWLIVMAARPPQHTHLVPALLWSAALVQAAGLVPAAVAFRHASGIIVRLLSAVAVSVNLGMLAWVLTLNAA